MLLWPKPDVIAIEPPTKPNRLIWLSLFIVLFILTGTVLILGWSDGNYFSAFLFWLTLILVPATVGGLALSIRFYFYGLAQERFDIWQQEQIHVNDNWQNWAMSGTDVIASYWISPNELTATKILLDRQSIPVQIGNTLEFDNEQMDDAHYFEDILFTFAETLNSLPDNMMITITVYSSPQSYGYLDEIIHTAYRRSKINKSYRFVHQLAPHSEVDKIIDLIDNQQYEAQLIITNNLLSTGSAFLAAVLLVDEQLSFESEQKVDVQSKILRPMVSEDIQQAVEQMVEMQPAIRQIKQLWCANLSKEQELEMMRQLAIYNISPDSINYFDSLAGKQTDLAYWSLLSVVNQLVTQTQQTMLLATISQGKYLFSVLTSTNLGITNEE